MEWEEVEVEVEEEVEEEEEEGGKALEEEEGGKVEDEEVVEERGIEDGKVGINPDVDPGSV